MAPPPAAKAMIELWKSKLDPDVRADLRDLAKCEEDQRDFAKTLRRLLNHLDLDVGLGRGRPGRCPGPFRRLGR